MNCGMTRSWRLVWDVRRVQGTISCGMAPYRTRFWDGGGVHSLFCRGMAEAIRGCGMTEVFARTFCGIAGVVPRRGMAAMFTVTSCGMAAVSNSVRIIRHQPGSQGDWWGRALIWNMVPAALG